MDQVEEHSGEEQDDVQPIAVAAQPSPQTRSAAAR